MKILRYIKDYTRPETHVQLLFDFSINEYNRLIHKSNKAEKSLEKYIYDVFLKEVKA